MTITDAERAQLDELYEDFAGTGRCAPQRDDPMPMNPRPTAVRHRWRWAELLPLAERSGRLGPVRRGGERRAIAFSDPGPEGLPCTTRTLWAAIQYVEPGEAAPSHHHTQGAFRFVLDGEGVWTNVDGDPVAMRRGDLLLTPGWAFHDHHIVTDRAMAWLVAGLDVVFFEFGPDALATTASPERSRSERLWGHPGLRPVSQPGGPDSRLAAYRWEHTDAALTAQLELEAEDVPGTIEHGHAGVRFSNPATGRDALATIRSEMHRLAPGTRTAPVRRTGTAVWQVFDGHAIASVGNERFELGTGDLLAVPSWCELSWQAHSQTDLFGFSDEPLYEAAELAREESLR